MPIQGGANQNGVFSGNLLQGYVFESGIHKPEHSNILSFKYPQYLITALLERLGSYEGIAQDTWTWNEMNRTRKAVTATAAITAGGVLAIAAINNGYLIAGDIIRDSNTGFTYRVDTVTSATSVTLSRTDGTAIAAGMVADAAKLGHITSAHPEASQAPKGRVYLPEQEVNYLQILRRSFKVSGSEFTNRTWLGDGKAWYFTQEDIEMKEFRRDQEATVLFGQAPATQTTVSGVAGTKYTKGVYEYIKGNEVGYAKTADEATFEASLQERIRTLMVAGSSKEMTVICGSKYLSRVQTALRDYVIYGGTSHNISNDVAGLDFQTYKYMGITVRFAFYDLFEDTEMLPTVTADSDTVDFSDFAMFLDFGKGTSGEKLIQLKHKELNGQSRKFIHAYEVGMMNPNGANGGLVSNGDDAFSIHYLSEIGIEVRLKHRHGIHRANS